MTKQEVINTINQATKAIANLFVDAKFEAVKLKQGDQLVEVQGELAPGTKVITSSSQGSVPAADDTYELSNGVSFSTKAGAIEKVINDGKQEDAKDEKLADDEDSADENMADAPASDDDSQADAEDANEDADEAKADEANTAAIQALTDKVSQLEQAIVAIQQALSASASKEDMKAIGDQFSKIQSAFEVLADTPSQFSKVDNTPSAREIKYQKIEALAAITSKLK